MKCFALEVLLVLGLVSVAEAAPKKAEGKITHFIVAETEYYITGPQQATPPDGTFAARTRVTLLTKAESYSLVKSEDGIKAYVAADALREVPTESELKVAESSNQFAVDLYGKLAEQEGNLFFSPLSISTALAMTYAGAEGETETQMADVLHFALPEQQLHPAFANLTKQLQTDDKSRGYRLFVANRLWGQAGQDFMLEFLNVTKTKYGAELAQVDFVRQTENARQEINAWVEKQTQEKIKDLITEGVLDDMTRLVLTNAIYFKGDWTEKFNPKYTKEAPFHVSEKEEVKIPLMHQSEHFGYQEANSLHVLELPYGKKDLSMIVLLPEKVDGLADLERRLSPKNLGLWMTGLRSQEVAVSLPRFKLESQFELKDALQSLGMTLAFTAGQADFSGITSSEQLYISAAIHKAFVDVNEKGTEAAAATAIVAVPASATKPTVFRADHPFLFLIRDNRTGVILFMGRFVGPG